MGIRVPIDPGGLSPQHQVMPSISADDLMIGDPILQRHPSFDDLHGEDVAPGIRLVSEYVEKGYGHLYSDIAAAEEHFPAGGASADGKFGEASARWQYETQAHTRPQG